MVNNMSLNQLILIIKE